jgi:hypothetical protein
MSGPEVMPTCKLGISRLAIVVGSSSLNQCMRWCEWVVMHVRPRLRSLSHDLTSAIRTKTKVFDLDGDEMLGSQSPSHPAHSIVTPGTLPCSPFHPGIVKSNEALTSNTLEPNEAVEKRRDAGTDRHYNAITMAGIAKLRDRDKRNCLRGAAQRQITE